MATKPSSAADNDQFTSKILTPRTPSLRVPNRTDYHSKLQSLVDRADGSHTLQDPVSWRCIGWNVQVNVKNKVGTLP